VFLFLLASFIFSSFMLLRSIDVLILLHRALWSISQDRQVLALIYLLLFRTWDIFVNSTLFMFTQL